MTELDRQLIAIGATAVVVIDAHRELLVAKGFRSRLSTPDLSLINKADISVATCQLTVEHAEGDLLSLIEKYKFKAQQKEHDRCKDTAEKVRKKRRSNG